jgi:hypothetical protein
MAVDYFPVGLEVLTAPTMESTIFWDAMSHSPMNIHVPPDYMVSYELWEDGSYRDI